MNQRNRCFHFYFLTEELKLISALILVNNVLTKSLSWGSLVVILRAPAGPN